MKSKREYPAIDIAKYIGALLVVAIHTFPFADISESFNLFFIATICRLAVPMFFVCSSFFLFQKIDRTPGHEGQNRQALMHTLKRLGILYLIWTVIYLPYTIWNYASVGFSFSALLGWIRDFFLNGSYYHLWFLPALMLGLAIVYWLYTRKGMRDTLMICLALYLFGWLVNCFGPMWEGLPVVSVIYGFILKLLGTVRDGIFFAPIFVLIGLGASKLRRMRLQASATSFAISFVCLILEVTLYAWMGVLTDKSCMYLTLVPAMYFLMQMLIGYRLPSKPVYKTMRKEATGIYVSHILFARILLLLMPNVHLAVYLGTLACSQGLATLIVRGQKKAEWLKWLV